jgi:hypothetical protein
MLVKRATLEKWRAEEAAECLSREGCVNHTEEHMFDDQASPLALWYHLLHITSTSAAGTAPVRKRGDRVRRSLGLGLGILFGLVDLLLAVRFLLALL